MHDEGPVCADAQLCEIQIDPAGLRVVMIKIHHNENDVFFPRVGLAVAEEERLVGRMKAEMAIALQSWMRPAYFIHASNQCL